MNAKLLEKSYDKICEMINNCEIIDKKEKEHRIKAIKKACDESKERDTIVDRYLQLAHEVYCMEYLKSHGVVTMASDSRHQAGSDFFWKDNYYIESVCASKGDIQKNGLEKFMIQNKTIDYATKKEIINSRLTQTMKAKKDFYKNHIKSKTILPEKPYIIFLGLGSLQMEYSSGENAIDFNDVLFGKGMPEVSIKKETNEVISCGYSYRENIKKYNGTSINCNLFLNKDYQCISGVIFTTAVLSELYDAQNTYLFVNPLAENKIILKDFEALPYWHISEDSSQYEFHRSVNNK